MNERTKELARQAGIDDSIFPIDQWENPELEKYTELLIEQCYLYIAGEMGLIWDGGLEKTKQHFGVE